MGRVLPCGSCVAMQVVCHYVVLVSCGSCVVMWVVPSAQTAARSVECADRYMSRPTGSVKCTDS